MLEWLTLLLQSVFHVKAVPHDPGLLDLEVAEEEEFSPDKLRATLERLYMTVVRMTSIIYRNWPLNYP